METVLELKLRDLDEPLETFLSGMETSVKRWCRNRGRRLETFLSGMETNAQGGRLMSIFTPLKPSLVEWKQAEVKKVELGTLDP